LASTADKDRDQKSRDDKSSDSVSKPDNDKDQDNKTRDDKLSKKSQTNVVHIFWITLCLALILSIYLAYIEAVSEKSVLDYLLPRVDVSKIGNSTEITQIIPEKVHPPFVPRFVIIWGFIGAATYTLKVTAKYLTNEEKRREKFDEKYIPVHIVRLFLGTTLAIIVYFVLSTGGFFGLTIDVTKMSNLNLVQYAYAVVAFIAGYSVRHIIHILSGIANSIFMLETEKEKVVTKDNI